MLKLHTWTRSRDRRSPRRVAQNKRLNVESLECRALLSGLTINGAYGNDISGSGVQISEVATDPSGNTYFTGSYTGSISVRTNSSTVTFPDITSKPETFVASYSATGAFNWYDQFQNSMIATDPNSTSNGASLAYDSLNQTVYVVGNFTGTVNFDPYGSQEGDVEKASTAPGSHEDASDAYIIGLNANTGKENTSLVTSFEDFVKTESANAVTVTPTQVTVDSAGDSIYVTGYYSNADTSDFPNATITVTDLYGGAFPLVPPPSSTEGFSAKFNVNERLAWAINTYGASGQPLTDAVNFGIAPAPQANVDYIVGQNADSSAAFVETVRDTNGQYVKEVNLNTQPSDSNPTSPVDYATGVVADSAGNAYVVGTFSGNLVLPLQNLTSAGATNAFIVKFNSNFTEQWADRFGSSNQQSLAPGNVGDDADAVGIDGAGTPDIYVSGEDEGLSSYGTDYSSVVGQNSGNVEAYVIEVASNTGDFIDGVGATGSDGTSEAQYLAVNSNGQVAVAGYYTAPTTLATTSLTSGNQVLIANLTGIVPAFDLAITITDSSTTYIAGGNTTYTITVSNDGPSAVTGATVVDTFSSYIHFDNWTAVASMGASVTTANGSGGISQPVDLQPGATVTFTVVAHVSALTTGNIFDIAAVSTIAIMPAGVTDSNTADVTVTPATPTPTPIATPLFTGEHRVYAGKGKHKKLIGFDLVFNGALNPSTAQNTSNYSVLAKHKKKLQHLPVRSATYNAANFTIMLTVAGFKTTQVADVYIGAVTGINGYSVTVNKVQL